MTAGTILDLVILVSLLFFAVNGFLTGFIIQLGRLFALGFGIWAMGKWSDSVAEYLQFVSNPAWRGALAALLVFMVVLLVVGILARGVEKLVRFSLGGVLDQLAGAVFSLAVGVLFWTLALMFVQRIFPHAQFLQESWAVPWCNQLVERWGDIFPPLLSPVAPQPA